MTILRFLALTLLLASTFLGLRNGPSNIRNAESTGQLVVAIAVTVYGIAGLASAFGLSRRAQWTRAPIVVWSLSTLTAATVAPRAYGGGEVSVWGILAGSIVTALIVGAVVAFVLRDLQRSKRQGSR
jgi:hypothetical protein